MNTLLHAIDLINTLPTVVPDPGPGTRPPGAEKLLLVMGWIRFICLGIIVIGVFIVGAQMGINIRHGEGALHLNRLGGIMAGAVLVSVAVALIATLAGA